MRVRTYVFAVIAMVLSVFTVQADVIMVNPGYVSASYCGSCHQETKPQTQNSLQNQNFERTSSNTNTLMNLVKVRPGANVKHKVATHKCGSFAKVKLQKYNRVSGGGSIGGIRIQPKQNREISDKNGHLSSHFLFLYYTNTS
jgi:hypothetical protein